MKKAYIQPEAQLLSLASLEDFLVSSPDKPETDTDTDWGNEGGDDYDEWA